MFKRLVIIIAIITLFTVSISADHGGDHVTVDEILSMVDYIIDPGSSQLNPAEAKFCDGRIDITDISSHISALINRQTPESQCSLCGNNVLETGEVCDGTNLAGQSCNTQGFTGGTLSCATNCLSFNTNLCTTNLCGNNVVETGEVCDDGNTASSDGCSNSCVIESGFTCTGTPSSCVRTPSPSVCGNNVVETGEVCDGTSLAGRSCNNQGFTAGTLSCSADCQSLNTNLCATALCGNNVVETGEVCDGTNLAGQSCSTQGFTQGTLSCIGDCRSFNINLCVTNHFCGDGILNAQDAGEQCDDANTRNGDGCSSGCRRETYNPSMCGDGVAFNFEDNRQEECDGSDLRNLDCTNLGFRGGNLGCSSACRYETGNCDSTNRLVAFSQSSTMVYCEESDGGINPNSPSDVIIFNRQGVPVKFSDYCAQSDSLTEYSCVRNGEDVIFNGDFVECSGGVCENGACVSSPRGICGNGLIERGEQCDDGNTAFFDGCARSCIIDSGWSCSGQPSQCVQEICGNGRIGGGENCDDANAVNGDGCSNACAIEQNYLCSGTPSVCSKTSVGEQRTLVILLDYDNAVESYEGMRSQIRSIMDGFNGYIRDVSFGRAWLSTDIVGPYRVSTADCVQNSRNGVVILQKAIQAADPDVDFNRDYRRIVVLSNDNIPITICNSRGDNSGSGIIRENEYLSLFAMQTNERRVVASVFRSTLGFQQSLFNLAHEMGHNFGDILQHVEHMSCSVGGQRTVMSLNLRDCATDQWSQTDPMGVRMVHYNAANTEFLGWLLPNQAVTTTAGSYTLEPLSSSSNGVKLIKIPSQITDYRGSYNYFLEFRQPTGRDSEQFPRGFPLNGVFLYLQLTGTPIMYLLEPPPYTNPTAFTHKPLPVNQPIILPEGIRITVTSQSSSGARIELS